MCGGVGGWLSAWCLFARDECIVVETEVTHLKHEHEGGLLSLFCHGE